MSEYRRNYVAGGTFFFTAVTYRRRPILTSEIARDALRQAMREVRGRRPFSVTAIVLLPDHLHTIWTLPEEVADYSVLWKQVKSRFTQLYLERGGIENGVSMSRSLKGERGVWGRRFFEHTVRDERDLKRCVDYIHINPLKHGLVERASDWPWSSFHRYAALGEYASEWGSDRKFYGDEWLQYE
jgi:putative transposase